MGYYTTALSLVLGIALLATGAEAAAKESSLHYHSSMPKWQKRLLEDDISSLSRFEQPGPELMRLMGVPIGTRHPVSTWVAERVKWILGDDAPIQSLIFDAGFHRYENPEQRPLLGTSLANLVIPDKLELDGVVMWNLGALLYTSGKEQGRLKGIRLDKSEVLIRSPRAGLLQVGKGLFQKDASSPLGNRKSEVSRIYRLSALVHEARHSDGHGKNLGFFHVMCPEGHELEGMNACDDSENGSYALDAAFVREGLKNCKSCDPREREVLNALILDAASRVVTDGPARKRRIQLKRVEDLEKVRSSLAAAAVINSEQGQWAREELASVIAEIETLKKDIAASETTTPSAWRDPKPEGLHSTGAKP